MNLTRLFSGRMISRSRILLGGALAFASLSFMLPGSAQAHPHLRGNWNLVNGGQIFDRLECEHGVEVAPGIWEGRFRNYTNGGTAHGVYILNAQTGALTFRFNGGRETAHFVNLNSGEMRYGWAVYRRDW